MKATGLALRDPLQNSKVMEQFIQRQAVMVYTAPITGTSSMNPPSGFLKHSSPILWVRKSRS